MLPSYHDTLYPKITPKRGRQIPIVLVAIFGPLVIWGAGTSLAAALASPVNADGRCSGLGWGCDLTPRDTMLFLQYIGLFTVVPVVTIVTSLLLLVPERSRRTAVLTSVGLFGLAVLALVCVL